MGIFNFFKRKPTAAPSIHKEPAGQSGVNEQRARRKDVVSERADIPGRQRPGIPTVKFDSLRVTREIQRRILESANSIDGLDDAQKKAIGQAVIESTKRGGDLSYLSKVIIEVTGLHRNKAAGIALHQNNKAVAAITREQQKSIGVTQAIWCYSNAPCIPRSGPPTEEDRARDAQHKAATGKHYDVATGLLINGAYEYPGESPGCKCVSRPVISGFRY